MSLLQAHRIHPGDANEMMWMCALCGIVEEKTIDWKIVLRRWNQGCESALHYNRKTAVRRIWRSFEPESNRINRQIRQDEKIWGKIEWHSRRRTCMRFVEHISGLVQIHTDTWRAHTPRCYTYRSYTRHSRTLGIPRTESYIQNVVICACVFPFSRCSPFDWIREIHVSHSHNHTSYTEPSQPNMLKIEQSRANCRLNRFVQRVINNNFIASHSILGKWNTTPDFRGIIRQRQHWSFAGYKNSLDFLQDIYSIWVDWTSIFGANFFHCRRRRRECQLGFIWDVSCASIRRTVKQRTNGHIDEIRFEWAAIALLTTQWTEKM